MVTLRRHTSYGSEAWRIHILSYLALAVTCLLWVVALPAINPAELGDLGLIPVLPLTFYAALVLLVISFTAALCRTQLSKLVLFLHIVVFILLIHATPVLVYETLRYSWAWKHVGIVDYILRYGTVDRTIFDMDAYHNWPGFFAATALLTRAAGLDSAFSFAPWGPVLFNLLNLGALLLLFRTFVKSERFVWLALWFYFITSWVAQDYFAPQAFAVFFHLVILAIAAQWFAKGDRHALLRTQAELEIIDAFGTDPALERSRSAPKAVIGAALLLLVGLFVTLATSHQLTPFITILSLAVLSIFTRQRAVALPLLMTVITMTWIIYGAAPFFADVFRELVGSLGQLSGNIDETLIGLGGVSPGQRIVILTGRALTLTVWLLAFIGVVKHVWRARRRSHWTLVLLAGIPFLLLGANSYGGEVLFRVYLFALPFMALWLAYLLDIGTRPRVSWAQFVAILSLSAVLIASFVITYYGKEAQFYFSPTEIEAAQVMYAAAPQGSLIVEGTPNYPSRYWRYDYYTHVSIVSESLDSRDNVLGDPATTLERWMSNEAYTNAFLIVTRSQKVQLESLGGMPPGSLDHIEQTLLNSPAFTTLYRSEDAAVFTLRDRPREVLP